VELGLIWLMCVCQPEWRVSSAYVPKYCESYAAILVFVKCVHCECLP